MIGLACVALLLLGSAGQADAQQPNVVVYSGSNFSGDSWSVGTGVHPFSAISNSPVGNDRISSIAIPDGYEVFACQHSDRGGVCETYRDSITQLTTLNNQISHLEVDLEGQPDTTGSWSSVIETPLVPVAASALPNGKVLMWSAYGRYQFGGALGYTQTSLFDPATNSSTLRQVSNTGHDMFCPGITNLADGRILVNGGSNAAETTIYDPATDSWNNADDMNIARGYNATTLLSDGSAFTLGGSWSGGLGNKNAERWTEQTGWQRLTGVPAAPFQGDDPAGVYRSDNHMWLFGWKNNTVFHAGPSENMHWINTDGSGSYAFAGKRASDSYAINGNAVMYAPGKILTVGGAATYSTGNARNTATVIDITGQTATARTVAPMAKGRVFQSSTVLANGEVLVTGGQEIIQEFRDTNAVMTPEIWNPETETFRPVANHAVPRTYHSMALLLPDARVMIGGGGLCGSCAFNHPDVEIYSPPYLFDADGSQASRPTILSSPNSVDLNERFEVGTDRPVSEFALVRSGSATHAVNLDQRRIPLQSAALGNNNFRLTMPADGGVAIPGSYMLFALDAQGVPSVAAQIRVSTDVAPEPIDSIEGFVSQENGTLRSGVQVDLFQQAADGSRGVYLRSTTTDAQGRYSFDVEPGCYSLTFVAPDGETIEGQSWNTQGVCLDANGQSNEVNPVIDNPSTGGEPEVRGTVSFSDGSPAVDVTVDLFAEGANGQRGQFLGSTKTATDGSYSFVAETNTCYILTMIAPSDAAFDSGQYFQPGTCVAQTDSVVDATLTSSSSQAAIGGTVSTATGAAVPGAFVDLFKANADGSRGAFVGSTETGSGGEYRFEPVPDCYILTFIAPGNETYGGSKWLQVPQCVDAGEVITNLDTSLD